MYLPRNEVMGLMARNYTIIEELQGHGVGLANHSRKDNKTTVRDFVGLRLKLFVVTSAGFAV
ncbi:hypothetical protein SAMN05216316_2736 [Nitrosovibrio sp. Nv6]|nr:hypothetical protein SAMN05216316_2736 [Nitrosovibrio sp. Nv6]